MRPSFLVMNLAFASLLACSGGSTVADPSASDDAGSTKADSGSTKADAGSTESDAATGDASAASTCGSYASGTYLQHQVVVSGDATCATGDIEVSLQWPIAPSGDCKVEQNVADCTTTRSCQQGIVSSTEVYKLPGTSTLTKFTSRKVSEAKSLQGGGNSKCEWDVTYTKK